MDRGQYWHDKMPGNSSIARLLERMPAGLVRRASEQVRNHPVTPTGIAELDAALGGGWACGRLNMLIPGPSASTGRTTVATATVAAVTSSGMPAAWIDGDGSMDPPSLLASGADTGRLLWVRGPMTADAVLKAAHETIISGIFGVIVVRPPSDGWYGGGSMHWLRLSREAELSGAPVIVLARGSATSTGNASCTFFAALDADWSGPIGPGCLLDGGTLRTETNHADGHQAECTFSSHTPWQVFQ